jgi:hypothetical protein
VLVQEDRSLAHLFESAATPHAFVVDHDARVLASGTPNDWDRLRELVTRAERGGGLTEKLPAGSVTS